MFSKPTLPSGVGLALLIGVLGACLPAHAQELVLPDQSPLIQYVATNDSDWRPQLGDVFVAVVKPGTHEENTGYLIHPSGEYLSFRIGSGRGASTPLKQWIVADITWQHNRAIFGEDGLFMRMFMLGKGNDTDNLEFTHYGIHRTSNIDEILSFPSSRRYVSWGCILVSQHIRDEIERTYELESGKLKVFTVAKLSDFDSNLAAVVHDSRQLSYMN